MIISLLKEKPYLFVSLVLLVTVISNIFLYGHTVHLSLDVILGFSLLFYIVHDKERKMGYLKESKKTLEDNNEQLVYALSRIIDARDCHLLGHSSNVARYAVALAEEINLTAEQIRDIKLAGLMHDLGKLAISEKILQKPCGLTDKEYETVKNHALIGEKLVSSVKGLERVSNIIGQHHEHYNGEGYPRRLAGEHIMIEARILALCDAFDTMVSKRTYKMEWNIEQALIEIVRCKNKQFDPQLVDNFLKIVRRLYPEINFLKNTDISDLEILIS